MTAQEPGIMQGQHHWDPLADPRKNPQIEIIAMEVMTVYDLRTLRRYFKEPPCPWKVEIFNPMPPIHEALRLTDPLEVRPQPSGPSDSTDEGDERISQRGPDSPPTV